MSFSINWDLLKDGKEAKQLQDFLNDKFSSITRPNFLGPISIQAFDFGTIPPEIGLENITDPIEEFYIDLYEPQAASHSVGIDGISASESNRGSLDGSSSIEHSIIRNDTDFQIEISIAYKGDMSMSISTELIINQPTPNFMSLPLTLTLTKTSFQAMAIIAYIGNTINICLEEPDGGDYILKEFQIESAIGDDNKQVLKNVGKIEKFILTQLNNFLKEYVVFPNYHSILLEPMNREES